MGGSVIDRTEAVTPAQPRLRVNLAANSAGSILTSLIQFAIVPVYVRMLGAEAYGLVGVQTVLQGLVQVLDFGVSASINRELARRTAVGRASAETRNFVRTLELGYNAIGVVLGIAIFLAAPAVERWVKHDSLSAAQARDAVRAMALLLAVQWPLSFYQGGLLGLQRHLLLNSIRVGFSALGALGAYIVLARVSATPVALFLWLALVAGGQLAILAACMWWSLPGRERARVDVASTVTIRRFAAGMTGVTATALLLSQLDRLVTSRMLPLGTFGYYMLGATIANAVLYTCISPVYASVFPRLAALTAVGDPAQVRHSYRLAWAVMTLLVVPVAAVFSFYAFPIVLAWTHDPNATAVAAPVGLLLVDGMALYGLLSITSALQIAHGWTGLALRINVVLCVIALPAAIGLARWYGAIGAASVWPAVNVGLAAASIPITHYRASEVGGSAWMVEDILVPILVCVAAVWIFRWAMPMPSPQLISTAFTGALAWIPAAGIIVLLNPLLRRHAAAWLGRIDGSALEPRP